MAGSTYNGQFEDVEGLDKLCGEAHQSHLQTFAYAGL